MSSDKKFINVFEKRNIASLKLMESDSTEYYLGNHFLLLSHELKLKRGITQARTVDDVSNVWLSGVTFNYLEYLLDGDVYIDRLLNTNQKEQSFVIKTKDLDYANDIIGKYLEKNKFPVLVVNKDDINFTSFNNIFNYNLKSEKKLNVLFDNVKDLKGKVRPTTIEQEKQKNKQGNSPVVREVKQLLSNGGELDKYNQSIYRLITG